MSRYYRPERMTISGVNVDHEELVQYCNKYFLLNAPILKNSLDPDCSIAQYTGGFVKVFQYYWYYFSRSLYFNAKKPVCFL